MHGGKFEDGVWGVVDRLFIARWWSLERRSSQQFESIRPHLLAARARMGKPLIYVSLSRELSLRTDAEERRAMETIGLAILEQAEIFAIILEGDNLKQALMRTLMRTMITAQRKSDRVVLHGTLRELLEKQKHLLQQPPTMVMNLVEAQGLMKVSP